MLDTIHLEVALTELERCSKMLHPSVFTIHILCAKWWRWNINHILKNRRSPCWHNLTLLSKDANQNCQSWRVYSYGLQLPFALPFVKKRYFSSNCSKLELNVMIINVIWCWFIYSVRSWIKMSRVLTCETFFLPPWRILQSCTKLPIQIPRQENKLPILYGQEVTRKIIIYFSEIFNRSSVQVSVTS